MYESLDEDSTKTIRRIKLSVKSGSMAYSNNGRDPNKSSRNHAAAEDELHTSSYFCLMCHISRSLPPPFGLCPPSPHVVWNVTSGYNRWEIIITACQLCILHGGDRLDYFSSSSSPLIWLSLFVFAHFKMDLWGLSYKTFSDPYNFKQSIYYQLQISWVVRLSDS